MIKLLFGKKKTPQLTVRHIHCGDDGTEIVASGAEPEGEEPDAYPCGHANSFQDAPNLDLFIVYFSFQNWAPAVSILGG